MRPVSVVVPALALFFFGAAANAAPPEPPPPGAKVGAIAGLSRGSQRSCRATLRPLYPAPGGHRHRPARPKDGPARRRPWGTSPRLLPALPPP
jgi:hypothetical protein